MARQLSLLCRIAILTAASISFAAQKPIPDHPSKLTYDSLKWEVPMGTPYRTVLKNGLRAYIASDSSLPIVKLVGYVKYGSLADPIGKEGVGSLMTRLMRTGGTEKYQADTLDALIDLIAMRVSLSITESAIQFNAAFLSDYTDTALALLDQILFHPVFDKRKLDKEVALYRESIRHRFDNPGPTLDALYQKAMYPHEAASSLVTAQSLSKITRLDCITLHKRVFHTGNIILAIAGRFDRDSMISKLGKVFPAGDTSRLDSIFPVITTAPQVKCMVVYKPITQAYVRMGTPLFKRPDPDYNAVSILNQVLGGGGFTSRLGTKVRSDEGLTYSIYSDAQSNYAYPGTWYIEFYTKNESFQKAMALTLQETARLRDGGVTDEELADAKKVLIGDMPSTFRTPYDIASTYAWNEYYGRPQDIFKTYPQAIRAITKDEVSRIAKKYLHPNLFTYAIVGDTAALLKSTPAPGFSYPGLAKKVIDADAIQRLP